jgi:hypothetical protein
MIMADVLKIVFLIVGLLICYISYWLAAAALFPSVVDRARRQYECHPFRITLVGLALAVPFILVSIGIGKVAHPLAKMLGVGVISVPILYGLVGSAGLALRIGASLQSSLDETQPWRRVLRGAIVLSFTFLLPVIGWFVVMPWTLVSGLGASVSAMFQKQPAPIPQAQVVGRLPAGGALPPEAVDQAKEAVG